MKRRHILGFTLVAAGLAIYFAWTPVLIWYHRRALDQVQAELTSRLTLPSESTHYANGIRGISVTDLVEKGDRHTRRLADLGYFFFKRYEMKNVPETSESERILFKLLRKHFPGHRHFSLSYPNNAIEVHDRVEEEPKWNAFAEKYNVSDLAERYESEANQQSNRQPELKGKTSPKTIEKYLAEWPKMGMWLPDEEQVNVFRNNLDTAREFLDKSLSNPDQSIRMRTAYVIGEIGSSARPLGEELLARLIVEPEVLVRMYIIDALNAIGYGTEETVRVLKDRYQALDGTNVPPNRNHMYSEVDEKIKVASALYVFADSDSKSEYFDFVTQWLAPPEKELSPDLLKGYWERRWGAVNSLEHMPNAKEAIPKLESLKAEPGARPWVNVHVPRVLSRLRDNSQ